MATLPWNQLVPNPFFGLAGVTGSVSTSKTIAMNHLLNPITILGAVTESNNPRATNQYDALLGKVERRFSRGFSILGAFIWSRQFEEKSFIGPQQLGVINHTLGNEDRPFHVSIAPVWEIPVGRGKAVGSHMSKVLDAVIGGWQLSGVFTLQSRLPVQFNTDSFFSGKDFSLARSVQNLNRWFDTTQFLPFPIKNTDIQRRHSDFHKAFQRFRSPFSQRRQKKAAKLRRTPLANKRSRDSHGEQESRNRIGR